MYNLNNILEKIVFNYVKSEGYVIVYKDLKLQLLSNPDYPSIKSITDTLDYFNVENIAANVPKDALDQLPKFFLAFINKEHQTSIAQVEVKNGTVKLLDNKGEKEKLSTTDFKEIWNGTIIAIEKNAETINNYSYTTSLLKYPLALFVLIATFTIINIIINYNVLSIIYLVTSAMGLVIGYFIAREALGLFSQSTSNVCNSSTNNTSCGEVINSSSSKLFGFVSLSDLTITYFLSLLIIIPILGYDTTFFFIISIFSIPVIVYTFNKQAITIKKWCPLCLMVSLLILFQVTLAFISFDTFIININYSLSSMLVFILVYISWSQSKALVIENKYLNQQATEHLKFKRNEKLFNTLLKEEPIVEPIHLNENSIVFGSPNAKLTINTVTNPLCGFCTKAFESYHKLLLKHPEDIKLNIIFNVPSNSLEQASSQISQRIIELYKESKQEAFSSLVYWFEVRDIAKWQTKFGLADEKSELSILKAHNDICDCNNITYTPAAIINNYMFPKAYDIEDISFFIKVLIELKFNKQFIHI